MHFPDSGKAEFLSPLVSIEASIGGGVGVWGVGWRARGFQNIWHICVTQSVYGICVENNYINIYIYICLCTVHEKAPCMESSKFSLSQ